MNAVITGATKGIGWAIARIFVQNGVNVVINSRNEADLLKAKQELEALNDGVKIWTRKTDMSIKSEVNSFGDYVNENLNQIDILVNNAGIFLPGMVHQEEDGILEQQMNTNLYSAYYLTRKVIGKMITAGSGHVFNICSVASIKAYPNGGSYSISKFALLGFSKVLREELKDKGVKVTSVLPGATWSNSWAGVELPHDRLMEADDIAKSIWNATQLSPAAVVEDIILRPQLGDL